MRKSTKREAYKKVLCGPGGFSCPCCRIFSRAKSKRINNRKRRRDIRQELKSLELN